MYDSIQPLFPSQAAALAAILLLSFDLRASDPPSRSQEVERLVQEARAAIDRLDVNRARVLWAQIYELDPSTMALCQLGQLDRRVGRFEEAAERLSRCVEQMPTPTTPVERLRYEVRHADLADVRQHVGEIQVIPPLGTVRTLVNGKEVNVSRPIFVKPGEHEVTAIGQQGQVARTRVTIAPGESQRIPLAFEIRPAAATARAPAAPPSTPPPVRAGPKPWVIAAGAGATLTFITTGLGLHQAGISADIDAQAKENRIHLQHICKCDARYPQLYADATGTQARANTMHMLGSAAVVAGGMLGLATVIYVVLPHDAQIQARSNGAEVTVKW